MSYRPRLLCAAVDDIQSLALTNCKSTYQYQYNNILLCRSQAVARWARSCWLQPRYSRPSCETGTRTSVFRLDSSSSTWAWCHRVHEYSWLAEGVSYLRLVPPVPAGLTYLYAQTDSNQCMVHPPSSNGRRIAEGGRVWAGLSHSLPLKMSTSSAFWTLLSAVHLPFVPAKTLLLGVENLLLHANRQQKAAKQVWCKL